MVDNYLKNKLFGNSKKANRNTFLNKDIIKKRKNLS